MNTLGHSSDLKTLNKVAIHEKMNAVLNRVACCLDIIVVGKVIDEARNTRLKNDIVSADRASRHRDSYVQSLKFVPILFLFLNLE